MVELTGKRQNLDFQAIIILVILCASWGMQQVAVKIASQGVPLILQSGIRSVGATILVCIWMLIRRESIFSTDGAFWWGIAAGVLFAAEFLLIYLGLGFTNASRAVIFLYMSPFVVAIGAQLFIPGEKLRVIQIIGLCSAFAGIVVAFHESIFLPASGVLVGDAMLVAAAVFWGATTVLIKASPLAQVRASKTLLYQLAVSGLLLPIASFAAGETASLSLTALVVWSLVYQVVWIASITYLAWFWLLRYYPASRLASFTFLTPIFGVLAGGFILDEPITKSLLMALVLVGSGIYMVNQPKAG